MSRVVDAEEILLLNQTMEKQRKQVCLFGLSADPPTGEGGHVGIAKALSQLRESDGSFTFDQVRVLPVYRHTFSVSFVLLKVLLKIVCVFFVSNSLVFIIIVE